MYVAGVTDGSAFLAKYNDLPPSGDFNSDGRVDAADYIVWRKGLVTGAYMQTDYDVWRANFGQTAAMASSVTAGLSSRIDVAVPEPASFILLTSFIAPLCFNRYRRSGQPKSQRQIRSRRTT